MQVLLLQDLQGFTPIQPVSIESLFVIPTAPSEDFLNIQELENLSEGERWYKIDPTSVFKDSGRKDMVA